MAYVVTVQNRTRNDIMLLGVNRREGKLPLLERTTVSLSDAEWAIAKPGLDQGVTDGDVTYEVIRDGFGWVQATIDIGANGADADLQEDFSLGNDLPIGCIIMSASVQLVETANGPAHNAATCEILVGANSLFAAGMDILDATATVGDSAPADQNINTPLLVASAPVLRVDVVNDDIVDLTQGQVIASILYFNPAQA